MLSSVTEMARKTRDSERQIHPTGEMFSVDNQWKLEVRAAMATKGWDQGDLAVQIPCSPGNVTNLLKPIEQGGSKQSRLVKRVHELFGWKDTTGPVVAVKPNKALKRIERGWPKLDADDQETVAKLVESLAKR